MRSTSKRMRGFAIVSAIFILVVLGALGAFILNISSNQQIGSALDVQGVRAYQAARAGLEWGLYKVQSTAAYNFGHTSTDPNTRACPATPVSFSPTAPTLSNFTVTVICTATTDPSGGPTIYTIQSIACTPANTTGNGCPNINATATAPGPFYTERRLDVAF